MVMNISLPISSLSSFHNCVFRVGLIARSNHYLKSIPRKASFIGGAVLGGPNPAIPLDFTPQSRIPRKSRTILAPIPHPAKEFCRSQNLQWFHYFGLFGGYILRSSSNNNNKFALILRSDIALDYIRKKYYQLLEWFNITDIELGVSILWVG